MAIGARILKHSISPDGVELLTFEITIARMVLAEFNTHRMLSRNSASSRAIPVKMMIERVLKDPYIPEVWGSNKKGMQAGEEVDEAAAEMAKERWLIARDEAIKNAQCLLDIGIHKQITNRLLEPFMWHTVLVTATEWDNFYHLRNNPMAHPAIAAPAAMMQELHEESEPEQLGYGEWHLPLIGPEDYDLAFEKGVARDSKQLMDLMVKISSARCARVSYLTHEGKRDLDADIELHDRLLTGGHMSPFEHVARPMQVGMDRDICTQHLEGSGRGLLKSIWCGNLRGWIQYRKTIPGEADILGAL